MKKIISVMLVLTMVTMLFVACAKEEVKTFDYETTFVDVSVIAENKRVFENRIASNNKQERFEKEILELIDLINEGLIKDFNITFSKEKFESWEECNDYAQNVEPTKTYLGSYNHYLLFLAQEIIEDGNTWKNICDTDIKYVTIAFAEKNAWVGTCNEASCLAGLKNNMGAIYVFKNSFHAHNCHKEWQAVVVSVVE